MFDIILFIVFGVTNSRLAKQKGLNATSWVMRTVGLMVLGIFIGAFVFMINYHGSRDYASIQKYMFENPLKMLYIYFFEIGGGLLARYMIDRVPTQQDDNNSGDGWNGEQE